MSKKVGTAEPIEPIGSGGIGFPVLIIMIIGCLYGGTAPCGSYSCTPS